MKIKSNRIKIKQWITRRKLNTNHIQRTKNPVYSSNGDKTYIHKIPVSYQVKSSSSGEISEIIIFPDVAPRILNECRKRYQEYCLKDLTIRYKSMFDKPKATSGGTKLDKIVSYMGKCNKVFLTSMRVYCWQKVAMSIASTLPLSDTGSQENFQGVGI